MSANRSTPNKVPSASNGKDSQAQDKPECFVIMPISDPENYEAGHFGQVFDDLFVPACSKAGYLAVRADQVRQTNLIHLDVLQKTIESPMAICDLSNRNPNVMFELGLRQAFDKPVVLVQEYGTPPIFDITPLRYTEYHKDMLYRHVLEDQEKIASAITATKESIGNTKNVNSIVKLLSLTHGASLASISEADRESALLQLILTELANLRSDVHSADSKSRKDERPRVTKGISLKGISKDIKSTFDFMLTSEHSVKNGAKLALDIDSIKEKINTFVPEASYDHAEIDKLQEEVARLEREYQEWHERG